MNQLIANCRSFFAEPITMSRLALFLHCAGNAYLCMFLYPLFEKLFHAIFANDERRAHKASHDNRHAFTNAAPDAPCEPGVGDAPFRVLHLVAPKRCDVEVISAREVAPEGSDEETPAHEVGKVGGKPEVAGEGSVAVGGNRPVAGAAKDVESLAVHESDSTTTRQ